MTEQDHSCCKILAWMKYSNQWTYYATPFRALIDEKQQRRQVLGARTPPTLSSEVNIIFVKKKKKATKYIRHCETALCAVLLEKRKAKMMPRPMQQECLRVIHLLLNFYATEKVQNNNFSDLLVLSVCKMLSKLFW